MGSTHDSDGIDDASRDLAHLIHNASNLALGHLASLRRVPPPDNLADRLAVTEAALRRITTAVDAYVLGVRSRTERPGDPRPLDHAEPDDPPATLAEAMVLGLERARVEADRRRIAVVLPTTLERDVLADVVVPSLDLTASVVEALVQWGAATLASGGAVALSADRDDPRSGPSDAVRLTVTLSFADPDQALRTDAPSVWRWVAEGLCLRLGAEWCPEPDGRSIAVAFRSAATDPRSTRPARHPLGA